MRDAGKGSGTVGAGHTLRHPDSCCCHTPSCWALTSHMLLQPSFWMREAATAESPEILGDAWVTADMREVGVPRQDLTDPSPWSPRGGPRGLGVLHQQHSRPHAGCCRPELGRCRTSSPGLGRGDKPSATARREGRAQVTASYRNEWGCGTAARFLVLGRGVLKGSARAAAGSGSVPGHGGPGQRRGPAAPAEAAPHRDRHGSGRRLPTAAWPG